MGYWVKHHDYERNGFNVKTLDEARFWASFDFYTVIDRSNCTHVIV